MFIKSIRFKIIFWYMLILSATLFLFGVAIYHNLSLRLRGDIDELLRLRAEGITDSVDTYWETEKVEVSKGRRDLDFNKNNNINFNKITQRWVMEKTGDPILLNLIVRIFDRKGEPIASSKNMPDRTPLSREIFNSVLQGKSWFEDVDAEKVLRMPTTLRTLTMPVIENNRVAYIIQVSSPLTSLYSTLKRLKLALFLLLPLTVVLSGAIGAFLAKLTLDPVNRMIDTAQRITAENLNLRIATANTKDEIARLADTFNEMLGRLEHGFSSQRQFIEDLAHELKTPLAVMKGELEVTLKKMRSTQEYESTLGSSLEEVNRIIKILEDLLVLARLDRSVITLDMKPLDLGLLAESTLKDIKILAEQRNIDINFSTKGDIIVNGDESKIKHLFLNILDNALKYTLPGGKVNVDISQEHNEAKVTFADTGIGIAGNGLPHIFNRFYRVDKARSNRSFGLGLSIAKSIVEAHKGRIEVESNLNKGSTFIIFLPLASRP